MKRAIFIALIALAAFLPVPVFAAAPLTGTIQGQIVNGTQGGSEVGGLQVILVTLNSDNTTAAHATTTADTSGNFLFNGVAIGDNQTYVIGVVFKQVQYATDVSALSSGQTDKAVKVDVYDTTSDDAAITVVNAHTVVLPEPGALSILEVYTIANSSDLTYVGAGQASGAGKDTLTFPLPTKATGLSLGGDISGQTPDLGNGSFSIAMPVFPGETQAFYTYDVTTDSSTYTYSRKVYYPTLSYDLMVSGDSISVDSTQLTLGSPVELAGSHFNSLTGDNLTAGSTIVATLSGLAVAGRGPSLLWIGLVLAALGGLAVAAVFLLGKRRNAATVPSEEGENDQEGRLVEAIATLDDDFEDGKVDVESYHRRRAELKSTLERFIEQANESKAGS